MTNYDSRSPYLGSIVEAISITKNENQTISNNFSIFKERMLKFTGRYIKKFEGIEDDKEIKKRAETLVEQGLINVLDRLKKQKMFLELLNLGSKQNIDAYNPTLGNTFIELGLSAGIDIAVVSTHSFAFSKSGTKTEKLSVDSAQNISPDGNHGSVADMLSTQLLTGFQDKNTAAFSGKKYVLNEEEFYNLQHTLFFGTETEDYSIASPPNTVVLINEHAIEHPRELAHEMFAAQMIKEIRRTLFNEKAVTPSTEALKQDNPDVKRVLATELPWFDFFMSEPLFALKYIQEMNK